MQRGSACPEGHTQSDLATAFPFIGDCDLLFSIHQTKEQEGEEEEDQEEEEGSLKGGGEEEEEEMNREKDEEEICTETERQRNDDDEEEEDRVDETDFHPVQQSTQTRYSINSPTYQEELKQDRKEHYSRALPQQQQSAFDDVFGGFGGGSSPLGWSPRGAASSPDSSCMGYSFCRRVNSLLNTNFYVCL